MTEPQHHVQDSIKVGVLVRATHGPHKGKQGKVIEIYQDRSVPYEAFRAFIELPDQSGFFQTRVAWLVRLP